jgi:hypothetical protein
MSEEDINEIKTPLPDINTIQADKIEEDGLNKLKKIIDSTPRNNLLNILTELSQGYNINQNNISFSTVTKKEILKHRIKKKIREIHQKRVELQKKEEEKIDLQIV